MKGFLNPSRLDYVLFHLKMQVNDPTPLFDTFRFVHHVHDVEKHPGKIVFVLSEGDFDIDRVLWLDKLPVLFPCSGQKIFSYVDAQHNSLVFAHDVLKSAFYLLSGYQEYDNIVSADRLNRFSFTDSVQCKLGITDTPVVNYYFDRILRAIEDYRPQTPVLRKRPYDNFAFMLSHDVDLVDLYTSNYYLYKIKEVLGLRKSRLSRWKNFKLGVIGFLKYAGIIKRDNPYWNFEWMRSLERANKFTSTFYFLDQGVRHSDAYYSFAEPRIRELFAYLKSEDCEIGLHGTVESRTQASKMKSSLDKLAEQSHARIVGARQHRLLWKHPDTALIQEGIGLRYDTTLGFAAHEGFRNSYCMPFRLYDFRNERMLSLWEIPLNVMDGTLFAYQSYTIEQAHQKCQAIINEVKKFGGIFTLLWHNSFFDEDTYPGIQNFYSGILKHIADHAPENVSGPDVLQKLEQTITT